MKAILKAPVDLLWNGGIGTYVKASTESNADVGDKANDAIRVNGEDLRVKVVGEGGNLGLTQLGRIEFARRGAGGVGGKVNTDAIDNSAGVDTSDHEVNIKILLNGLVTEGDMTVKQRNKLLAEMTDEVGALVLRNNYAQNTALANALRPGALAAPRPPAVHAPPGAGRATSTGRWSSCRPTGRSGNCSTPGRGLTQPELAVLLAYTKITVADELIHTGAAGRPVPAQAAARVLPRAAARSSSPSRSTAHALRREIITTVLVNDTVNTGGSTFLHRLREETGASIEEIVRAQTAAREIFGLGAGLGRGRGAGQPGRGRCPDPDPAALAPAGRARHALAAGQPAAAAGDRRDHRVLRRGRGTGVGAAAQAAARRGTGRGIRASWRS